MVRDNGGFVGDPFGLFSPYGPAANIKYLDMTSWFQLAHSTRSYGFNIGYPVGWWSEYIGFFMGMGAGLIGRVWVWLCFTAGVVI
jgi:hypothetical protein